MRIRWTPAAADDLEAVSEYLRARHPQYRQPTVIRLYQTILSLKRGLALDSLVAIPEPENWCFHRCHTLLFTE
jgi:plasmid stabilization system protein ParE